MLRTREPTKGDFTRREDSITEEFINRCDKYYYEVTSKGSSESGVTFRLKYRARVEADVEVRTRVLPPPGVCPRTLPTNCTYLYGRTLAYAVDSGKN